MTELDRRTVVKGAAWMVPVIAVAIATPLAAASQPPVILKKRLRITNVAAHPGADLNTVYMNTMILVDDGPDPVTNLFVRITISRDGRAFEKTFPYVSGWGNTGQIQHSWPNIPKGGDITVTVTAMAANVEIVSGTDVVTAAEQNYWA